MRCPSVCARLAMGDYLASVCMTFVVVAIASSMPARKVLAQQEFDPPLNPSARFTGQTRGSSAQQEHERTPPESVPKCSIPNEEIYFEHPLFGWPKPEGAAGDNALHAYVRMMNKELKRISGMDLYGVTAQLPKGYAAFKWDWAFLNASRRFDDRRHVTPAVPPIEFSGPSGKKSLSLDLGLKGSGGGHTFQFSYGITDPLDWYIEIPFQYMDVSLNPVANPIDDQGNRIDPSLGAILGVKDPKAYSGRDFVLSTLPQLGRAPIAVRFRGKWLLGDINTGVSWNYYRTHRFSAAITPRVFFPTGHIADPNDSLLYGTGPELDVGTGSFGIGFTQGYDVRLWQGPGWLDIIASTEFTTAYRFPSKRKYPTNFVKPGAAARSLDPTGEMFPDLTPLKGKTFTYWPGWSLQWTVQLSIQVGFVELLAGYGIDYSQRPELHADPGFVRMVDALQLLAEQTYHAVELGASLNLLAFYIPVQAGFQWRKMVDGYNALIFDDYYQVTLKAYLPVNPD